MKHYDHPDANAAPIWEYLERVGCKLLQVEGCDRLVLIPGGAMVLVEVKNPDGKAKGGKLTYTRSERELMDWCKANGHDYWTVTSIEDMQAILQSFQGGGMTRNQLIDAVLIAALALVLLGALAAVVWP